MESIKTFSQNLKLKKELNKMKIARVARKCGYCPQTIFEAINGKRIPRLNTALCIAEVFGCSMDALLEYSGMRYYSEKQTPSERFKELRHKKKMSINRLSEATGVKGNSIWQFENDMADMSLSNIIKLAKFLDFSIDWLVCK